MISVPPLRIVVLVAVPRADVSDHLRPAARDRGADCGPAAKTSDELLASAQDRGVGRRPADEVSDDLHTSTQYRGIGRRTDPRGAAYSDELRPAVRDRGVGRRPTDVASNPLFPAAEDRGAGRRRRPGDKFPTICVPPLEIVVLVAVPLAKFPISCRPPPKIVVLVAVPLARLLRRTACPPLEIVVRSVAVALPVNPISCVPPLEIVVLIAVPPEIHLLQTGGHCGAARQAVIELRPAADLRAQVGAARVDGFAGARGPPELTVVADAVPPESTNIEPPLTTTSLVSLSPDETLYGEFPELTVTVLMEKLHR